MLSTYIVEVNVGFLPDSLSAEIEAKGRFAAIALAKEIYAQELGTAEEYINIVSITRIR